MDQVKDVGEGILNTAKDLVDQASNGTGDGSGGVLPKEIIIPVSIGGVVAVICLCCLIFFILRMCCPRVSP